MVKLNQALEKLVVNAVQEPKMGVMGGGKANVQICIQVIGKEAVDAALTPNGDIKHAMKFILDRLEPPRMQKLQALAVLCAVEETGSKRQAAKRLGLHEKTIYYRKFGWPQRIEAIEREAMKVLEDDESYESGCLDVQGPQANMADRAEDS